MRLVEDDGGGAPAGYGPCEQERSLGMCCSSKLFMVAVLTMPMLTFGQTPVWHNTLEDVASSTIDGGVLEGSAPVFAPGVVSPPRATVNKFQSTGDSRLFWGTTEVQTIFAGWNDTNGITVDLYFSGINGSTHSDDSGLWSVGHRGPDQALTIVVRDDTLRLSIGSPGSGPSSILQSADLNLQAAETYRVTVRQHATVGNGGDLEVYLDDLGGAVYSNAAPLLTKDLPDAYNFGFPLDAGGGPALGMNIGSRHPYDSASTRLQNGEAVDEVRVFNGNWTPAQLDIPEPASLLLMAGGAVALVRRPRKGGWNSH